MRILELDAAEGREIDRFDSRQARHLGLARLAGSGGVGIVRLDARVRAGSQALTALECPSGLVKRLTGPPVKITSPAVSTG